MPSANNWIHFIYVNLGFIAYIIGLYYLVSLQEIKANWPLYRCNPMYMPLSDNMEQDFTYCIQTTMSSFMGYILQPITFVTSSISSNLSSFTTEINSIRNMFSNIRGFISNIFQNIFGVFLNIVIEFQKITIGIRDLVGKTIGILVTIMYVINGSILTMQSAWNGPTGQLVQALGKCFHPETKLRLKNGNVLSMKDIHLGDVLENDSVVEAVMQIKNTHDESFYKIEGMGVDGCDIYVTGSHLILNKNDHLFMKVKNCSYAVHQQYDDSKSEWFSCLITSDNKIKVGNEIFWDWEDHFVKRMVKK